MVVRVISVRDLVLLLLVLLLRLVFKERRTRTAVCTVLVWIGVGTVLVDIGVCILVVDSLGVLVVLFVNVQLWYMVRLPRKGTDTGGRREILWSIYGREVVGQ